MLENKLRGRVQYELLSVVNAMMAMMVLRSLHTVALEVLMN